MSDLPARRAVKSGAEMVRVQSVLRAVARLALFHGGFIKLDRESVDEHMGVLVDFLAEVNDESPKV